MNLPYTATYPLLGVPLQIAGNDPRCLALAEESFGSWSGLAPDLVSPGPPARLDVVVEPRPGPLPGAGKLAIRTTGDRYEARAGNVLMTCDRPARHAIARVSSQLLEAAPDWYRWFVNGLALLPVVQRDRYPVHATGLRIGATAVLVFGASGRGKSTLAYAAARAGHQLLDEDTVFVAVEGGLRLWAHLERLSLAPDTVRWFGELADLQAMQLPHGKVRLPQPLEALGIRPALTHAGSVVLVALDRHHGAPRLESIAAADPWPRSWARPSRAST